MSKDYQICWPAHPNIYNKNSSRKFNVYFSEPEKGVNEDTGLVLFIAGFRGNANSNVYKKMRSKFADQYNLITIQCDYFGQEFMQGSNSVRFNFSRESLLNVFTSFEVERIFDDGFNMKSFIEFGSNYDIHVTANEKLNESIENYNEMGILQAIDNISAVLYVMKIIEDNNLSFNTKKIILFGYSHGAYLGYLCNALAPDLFSLLVDNSSWLIPEYIKAPRNLYKKFDKMMLNIQFNYLASTLPYDTELLNLSVLYKKFNNKCEIQSFHGVTDHLLHHHKKSEFCSQVANCNYTEVSGNKLDNKIFKSTNHGLDADFIKLFEYIMDNKKFNKAMNLIQKSVTITTKNADYTIDYDSGIPLLKRKVKVEVEYYDDKE